MEAITSIPLPSRPKEDSICWHYDIRGEYLVKSGYQLAYKVKFSDGSGSSSSNDKNWNAIWKLALPEKVKFFSWRAILNFLPTMDNLWRRKITQGWWCQRCGRMKEDVDHALFFCKKAKLVWREAGLASFLPNGCMFGDLLEMLTEVARRINSELERLVAICWSIWTTRNSLVMQGNEVDHTFILARAEATTESIKHLDQDHALMVMRSESASLGCWKAPLAGWFKLNVDASAHKNKATAGLGAIIRDEEGKIRGGR